MFLRGALLGCLAAFWGSAAVPPKLRLDDSVRPVRYAADLTLRTEAATFSGIIDIDVQLAKPAFLIWLNAVDITIRSAVVRAGGRMLSAAVEPGDANFVGLRVSSEIPAGAAHLRIRYDGKISRRDTAGIFQGRDGNQTYLYTQFEAIDARRAFPCFDQPNFKTPWQITLHVPREDKAVANTREISETAEAGGMERVAFAPTEPLPSYLVAFAVGPFDIVEAGRAGQNRVPVRIITPKGKGYQAKYAAEVTATIIQQLENYFGVPFPYDKSDQVAIPLTVGFSAMENAGMVTYAQSDILADPALDTTQRQRRYAANAAHELAHQWFGDLVTPVWWNDIWLNEAFATWTERKILSEWKPEWNTRLTDLGSEFGAMNQDSLVSTRSIRQPIESENDISNAFDGITYQKGASVIRMFETWVGEKQFQAGVKHYLTRYRFGNATANDFLDAVAANGRPQLTRAFSTFLDQPGFPEISVQLKCDGAPRVALRQKRYTPIGSAGAKPETWHVPVCLRYQTSRGPQQECFLLDQSSAEFTLTKAAGCPVILSGNADASGYYSTAYEPGMLQKLLESQDKFLNSPERRTVLHDLDMLADSGDAKISQALAAVPVFAKAPERPMVAEAEGVAREIRPLVPPDLLPNYQRFIRAAFGARAEALGWLSKRGDDDETRLLRAVLVPFVAVYGGDAALQTEARRLAGLWLQTRQGIDADMLSGVLSTAASSGGRSLFDSLLRTLRDTQDRHIRNVLIDALSSFRDPALVQAAMQLVLRPDFDPRESLPLLFPPESNPQTEKLPFAFVKAHYDDLVKRMPVGAGSDGRTRLLGVARGFCDENSRQQFANFFQQRSRQFLGGPRAFAQRDESIRLCEARKAAQGAGLAQFLRDQ